MTVQDRMKRSLTPYVEIEVSAAQEFLMTLQIVVDVLVKGNQDQPYEVGDQWFEMVSEKATPALLDAITKFSAGECKDWANMVGLAYDCPPPQDVPSLLTHIEMIDPLELRLHMIGYYQRHLRKNTPLDIMLLAAEGNEEAQAQFLKTSQPDDADWQQSLRHIFALDLLQTKHQILDIMEQWYERVFRDMEPQIMSIIERDAEAKRILKQTVTTERLIELATNGFEFVPEPGLRKVVLIPSYVERPWNHITEYQDAKIFIYPVADESIAEDSSTPPVRLVRLFKALADDRRLRILKKLTTGSYTLPELADDFGVAKTTMHHHLAILRSAGLVRVQSDERLYSLRQNGMPDISQMLDTYLKK